MSAYLDVNKYIFKTSYIRDILSQMKNHNNYLKYQQKINIMLNETPLTSNYFIKHNRNFNIFKSNFKFKTMEIIELFEISKQHTSQTKIEQHINIDNLYLYKDACIGLSIDQFQLVVDISKELEIFNNLKYYATE